MTKTEMVESHSRARIELFGSQHQQDEEEVGGRPCCVDFESRAAAPMTFTEKTTLKKVKDNFKKA